MFCLSFFVAVKFRKIFTCQFVFRVWFPEDLSDQGIIEIDAKLFKENKKIIQSTFDRTKMKQKILIPWKIRLESPMFRGR
jgi:hypothetical protein